MKLKKFFIRTVLAVSILNFMNVNLTFAQVPSKQALVQTKEAKIKTDKMDNTGNIDKNTYLKVQYLPHTKYGAIVEIK